MGIKDIRRNYILERAIKLFCSTRIADVKIKDVAEACNIGEATFYRLDRVRYDGAYRALYAVLDL